MKIKCTMSNAEDFELTEGRVYEVESILAGGRRRVIGDDGLGTYMKEGEFEVVEEWSGESLPTVGEIVRHIETGNSVEIACYFHGSVVYWDFNIGGFHSGIAEDFEPIKSEKQKEIDKIASELLESVNKNGDDFVYQEWVMAEHLYNAGLRFTEDSK